MENEMTQQQEAAPMPNFKCEYCFNSDWDGFRVRSLRPMPNFIVRLFAKVLLGMSYRKFIGV